MPNRCTGIDLVSLPGTTLSDAIEDALASAQEMGQGVLLEHDGQRYPIKAGDELEKLLKESRA